MVLRVAYPYRDEGDHMGIDDLVNQGKQFLDQNKDKIGDALKSDQAEDVSDKVLDAAAEFVKKVAPDSVDEHVDGVRDNIDKAIGNDAK
ncbi:antitoxin protein of toxin-antitoxin system [Microbacterium sp. SLBN-146]|nr:antitoxin protein of toxin-antitoxin system [Microbacterium sp. SLBN-146]